MISDIIDDYSLSALKSLLAANGFKNFVCQPNGNGFGSAYNIAKGVKIEWTSIVNYGGSDAPTHAMFDLISIWVRTLVKTEAKTWTEYRHKHQIRVGATGYASAHAAFSQAISVSNRIAGCEPLGNIQGQILQNIIIQNFHDRLKKERFADYLRLKVVKSRVENNEAFITITFRCWWNTQEDTFSGPRSSDYELECEKNLEFWPITIALMNGRMKLRMTHTRLVDLPTFDDPSFDVNALYSSIVDVLKSKLKVALECSSLQAEVDKLNRSIKAKQKAAALCDM